jgi:TonB-linked SusC/RagA family outer membrane protein
MAGNPITGVNVTVKGTKQGVSSDIDGNFELVIQPNTATLVFTFVGKEGVERQVRAGEYVTVTLNDQREQVEEVFVTGYFNRSKKTFTGAATSIEGEELRKISNQNVLSVLSVMDPSFKLLENNLMGSDPNQLPDFQVRGASNINSSFDEQYKGNPNTPTFMLDGFEVSLEKIFDLDPQRIQNVTILKDAAALAMYGSRGSNGVVVITTIPPAAGKLRLTYNASLDFEAAALADYNLLNAAEKLEYERLAGLYTPNNYIGTGEAYSFYYNERLKLVQQGNNTDWIKKPIKALGLGSKHSLTLEGGDQTFRYGVDLSYNPSAGVMKGSGRDRKGMVVTLNYNLDNLRFSNRLSFDNVASTNSPYGKFSEYAYLNPYYNPYDSNGGLKKILYEIESVRYPVVTVANPLYNSVINTKDETRYDNFINNFGIEWDVKRDLKLNGKLSINKRTLLGDVFKPSDHTEFLTAEKKGSYVKTTEESFQYEGTLGLNYTKFVNKNLFVANANYNVQEIKTDLYSVSASGFPNDKMDHIGMGLEYLDGSSPQGYEATSRLMGFLGSLNYSHDNRYLADLSIRYDGSSQFGSNKRWGTFWSAGLGWNIHEEAFAKGSDVVNILRLRGSTGYTGSQSFYPYQSIMMYRYLTDLTYDGLFGAIANAYGNTDLKWQKTQKNNIGLDFELFDSRISGYANLYADYSQDVLVDVTMAPSLGFDTYKANLGEVENKGFELSLKADILSRPSGGLFWSVFGSAVHNTNKLSKISNALRTYNDNVDGVISNKPSVRFIEGESMNTIWVVPSLGIDPATGQEVFVSRNGTITNVWNAADYVPYGNSDPTIEGTLGTNLSYKGFQVNIYMMYGLGRDIYNHSLVDKVENVDPNFNVDRRVFYDRWRNPGDIAAFKSIADRTLTRPTSRFVERENRLELRSVNLSYTIGQNRLFSQWGIERARLSAFMNDVFRISTVKAERGIDYPYAKHFALALQVTF